MEIERIRGDTYADSFIIKNSITKAVVNLTGFSAKLTVNSERNPTTTAAQLYQLTGDIPTPANGTIEFSPSLAQADNLGLYYFDIQLTDSFGDIQTVVKGTYKYVQDITK